MKIKTDTHKYTLNDRGDAIKERMVGGLETEYIYIPTGTREFYTKEQITLEYYKDGIFVRSVKNKKQT